MGNKSTINTSRKNTASHENLKKLEEYLKTSTSDSPTAVYNGFAKTLSIMPSTSEATLLYQIITRQLQHGKPVNSLISN